MGSQFFKRFNMKSLVAVFVALVFSVASADYTCDDCKSFGGKLQGYFETEESIAEQTGDLIQALCPQAEDPAMCESVISEWWPKMSAVLVPKFLDPEVCCSQLGVCSLKSMLSEPTCDECKNAMQGLSGLLMTQIDAMIVYLKGDALCGGSDETCIQVVDILMPYAIPALSQLLTVRAPEYCCALSTNGICC